MSRKNKNNNKKHRRKSYHYPSYDYIKPINISDSINNKRKSSSLDISTVALSIFGSDYYCVGDQCPTILE